MLNLGLSQAAIGRATGMKPATVRTAKTAATLTGDAAEQAHTHDLTLDQLAILAEFQTEEPAVALLVGAARRGALARVTRRDRTYARWVSSWGEPAMLGRILGVTDPDRHCADAAPTRHGALLWAQLCAAYETEFTKDAWRRTDPHRANYLRHLVSLGYTPSDTEQLMITATDRPPQ